MKKTIVCFLFLLISSSSYALTLRIYEGVPNGDGGYDFPSQEYKGVSLTTVFEDEEVYKFKPTKNTGCVVEKKEINLPSFPEGEMDLPVALLSCVEDSDTGIKPWFSLAVRKFTMLRIDDPLLDNATFLVFTQ